ncbi:hypothetical protein NNJEOMEG_00212 [Fundidesulfovibrio magnetotacticus]|uniref:DUF2065 domain-containing protein n=2 Tax=Fundidesulfovibrio magnetotacticus TaxID=2730080 RepID=A0A6V8LS02_9BACT|nr:hypothetical protein NNJEOMEG_00212 [Fundidesulfovibrio magnetotacticus]
MARSAHYHVPMNIDWKLLLLAVGLALVFEGMPYFLFAEKMPGVLRQLSAMKPRSLRFMGMTAMAVGLFLVWFMTRHAVLP